MPRGWMTLALAGLGVIAATPARGEPRPVHWGVGGGGFTALTGPAKWGPAMEVELYPGARWNRFGIRGVYLGLDRFNDLSQAVVMAGVTFEAASARPRLQLALHAEGGWDFAGDRVAVGAGVQTQLWIIGPVALGMDGAAYLLLDADPALVLGSTLTIRLAR